MEFWFNKYSQWIMTDITEEAATEVGEESKADEASAKKERIA